MAKMKPSTLRIGYRYRPQRLAESYDALVIGSGIWVDLPLLLCSVNLVGQCAVDEEIF